MSCMLECFSDKWKRRDVAGFLAGYQTGQSLPVRAVSRLIQEKRSNVDPLLERAAEDLAREIKERDVHFQEIHYSMRYDGNSGKHHGDCTRSGVPLYFILWVVQKFRFRSLQKEVWNRATDEIREKEGKH
nr:MAG TPA: hypothetical protein [Caudoviricetes sp.]